MLTEGWDANTVTHILGVRAFGTQLLCEQVVGRALRRQSYDQNAEGLFDVEYADILGIPFDFAAKPVVSAPAKPRETVRVHAVRPDRDSLEIVFPRVEGYRVELPDERLEAKFGPDHVDSVFGEGEAPFSGWSRAKDRLDAALGIEAPWSLHDLRRTLSTRLHDTGVKPHIVEAILAHVGHKAGVAGVYNQASYRPQKRQALKRWADLVAVIVGATTAPVVPLRRFELKSDGRRDGD